MKIGLLQIGEVPIEMAKRIQQSLTQVFPNTTCTIISETLPLQEEAFDEKRRQHRSNLLLGEIQRHAAKRRDIERFLGVVDADIFVPSLNFVFGEAASPGKAALISLWRLRPEFYGEQPETELFLERSVKEAVHEVGHTLGLGHCRRASCVMHFSNSIVDTDRKQSVFCDQCGLQVAARISQFG
jgi:archaemetzincin